MASTTKTADKADKAPSRASQAAISRSAGDADDKGRSADDKGTRAGKVTDKREAIMTAALDLFVERGFHGTAVPEIASKAGVGAGTIYRYFENKEALVNALYRQEKQRFAQHTLDEFPRSTIARELFRTMWMRMAKFAGDNPKPFVFLELHHHSEYLDAESIALEQRMLELFTNVVVAAQSRGELKEGPPGLLMAIVMGAFVGVIRNCAETRNVLTEADWTFAEKCVWEAIRA